MLRDRVQRMRETQSKPRAVKPVAAAPALTPAPSTTPRPRRTQTSTAPQSTPTATPARKHDPLPVVRPAQAEATVSLQPTEPSPTPLREPKSLPLPEHLTGKGELRRALEASKRALKAVGWFSCGINILMLTGPIFMLQVYDRVMTSGSYSTLTVLMLITAGLYGVIGVLELVRSRVITRIGVEIDQRIGDRVFEASMRKSLGGPGTAVGALRELDTLRSSSPAPRR